MGIARSAARVLGTGVAAGALTGLAAGLYGFYETRQFRLRLHEVPILPAGMRPVRVLQLTDIHMTPRQLRKQEWIRDLARLAPDLVIDTGDNLAHRDAVPVVLDTLGGLLDCPGVFVHGSNDYFSPGLRNPIGYLLPDNGKRHTDVPPLPWRDLSAGLSSAGWVDLTNRLGGLTVGETRFAFAGVDDPHLEYDDLAAVAGPADPDADVRLGIAHAPYLRVLDQYARDGYDAIIAGHTHGGQICLPGGRALATNCDLEPARARGLHRHPAAAPPGTPGSAWLHVSGGLGTSPYAPVRIACKPEAALLTLVPR